MTITIVKLLAAITFWGLSFVATKIALAEASPPTVVFLRFTLGALLLSSMMFWRERGSLTVRGRDVLYLCLLGAIGVFIHHLIQTTGLVYTQASSTGWLVALSPAFAALLARLFLKERFGPTRLVGMIVAFGGALLVISRGRLNASFLNLPSTLGDALVLASAFNWAVYSVLGKKPLRQYPALVVTGYAVVIGWLMLGLLFVCTRHWGEIGHLSFSGWAAIAFLGLFCSGLAYLFWYDGLREMDASQVTVFLYVQPLVTLVASHFILGEQIPLSALLGGFIIIAGVYLVNKQVTGRGRPTPFPPRTQDPCAAENPPSRRERP